MPLDAFFTFIEQDILYLESEAKALGIMAARSPDAETAAFWARCAVAAADAGLKLHKDLPDEAWALERELSRTHSPTCLGYASYLMAVAATEPYSVAAAAVLPCRWIYQEVGRALAERTTVTLASGRPHLYADWALRYEDEEFHAEVAQARSLVDVAAMEASEVERAAMAHAFSTSMRYELLFWDTALYPQAWVPSSERALSR
ncbi:transcriptional activator TenA [Rhodococcus rhodnii]|uniref:Transcriptional activator TenA n=1 Tax=Rhodococcus rhodnii LMG 5362 TaxID=1273125 RepID=R7WGW1_9NOCA|nr:transcriptional activator TenA [Rhodococcus rhodnii]EOM74345.1 transcriptional activator TenA [Rhodococcus rhodnii LMG 5362]